MNGNNDQDQWAKLYQYLDTRFTQVDEHFEVVEERIDGVQNTVDAIYKRQETTEIEQAAMKHQLDRHEKWHHKTAKKLDIQLDY